MQYRVGYCSRSVAFPSHLSCHNRISELSFIAKEPNLKRCFFAAISFFQKCEFPGFHPSCLSHAFGPKYLLHKRVCQAPTSVRSLQAICSVKHYFWHGCPVYLDLPNLLVGKPYSIWSLHPTKRIWSCRTHFGSWKNESIWRTMFVRIELIKTSILSTESNLPF